MYALFDEAGKFLAGRVMSEADNSMQVELESGRRVKVKSANVMLKFAQPEPAALMASARRIAGDIDLDLAWEFAPASEFGFADLARDYFSPGAGAEQQAAALFRLFDAPHYFRRLGKGVFKKAPEETVKAALLGIEKKRQQSVQIAAWAAELVGGRCPQPIREQLYKILFRPDKNASEYKAVVDAARRSQRSPLDLLSAAGAIDSAYQFHWRRFLYEQFPKGTAFAMHEVPQVADPLPLADVAAFSIDDSTTTEIDDALSVSGLGTARVRVGIHIAAPALAIAPDSALGRIARERLSTVYMPGWKLTMLPDEVVAAYTLCAGHERPAVSLYLDVDAATLDVVSAETRLERVPVAANLRHDELDAVVTADSLAGGARCPFGAELAFLFRLAQQLKLRREQQRGKPETFNRPDYTFKLEANAGHEPDGSERVQIAVRQRGAPLDLIVAEAMILANSHWGGWLDDNGVPAIYRSQASLAPGIKVRMGTKALPHAGIGVAHYSWATSPLRRYVDLVNQWQIIACARHGRTAPLAAPFKARDAELFSIVSAFDASYAAYNEFQAGIERFWTLRFIQQQSLCELPATALGNGLLRADTLPLVFRTAGAEALGRGMPVNARIARIDLLTLDVHATVTGQRDRGVERDDDSGDGEELPAAGPLTLAIDVADSAAEEARNGQTTGAAAA